MAKSNQQFQQHDRFAIKGNFVTPTEVVQGVMIVENGLITNISDTAYDGIEVYDFTSALVLPGFIDIHMHGLLGKDVYPTEDLSFIAENLLRFGVTSFLPTVACISHQQYINFANNVIKARQTTQGKAAQIVGMHFEGPFINPAQTGAMGVDTLRPMSVADCQQYLDAAQGNLKLMTLSPELHGSDEVIRLLHDNGVVVSMGHSIATPDEFHFAVDAGLSHICHLLNTFRLPTEIEPGVWKPGVVEHILIEDQVCGEIISDMHHVQPTYVKLIARMLGPDRFIAITDSVAMGGQTEGSFTASDGRVYTVVEGVSRLADKGTLAGSLITMNKAFANLVTVCDIDTVMAARFTSTNAARQMGLLETTGSIEMGKAADLAVLDNDFNCIATFVSGNLLHHSGSVVSVSEAVG